MKAANKKILAERSAAQSKVSQSVSDALLDGKADVNDILAVVRQSIASTNVEHNRGIAIIDAEKISFDDCKSTRSVMCATGKLAEMTFLRDRLDHMIRVANRPCSKPSKSPNVASVRSQRDATQAPR